MLLNQLTAVWTPSQWVRITFENMLNVVQLTFDFGGAYHLLQPEIRCRL